MKHIKYQIMLFLLLSTKSTLAVDIYQKYIVQLMCTNRGERLASYGTGTFVKIGDKNYILTCYHVIVGYENIDVQYAENPDVHKARLLYYDLNRDIALLGFDTHHYVSAFPLGNSLPMGIFNNPAILVGFPNGMDCNRFTVNFTHQNGYTSKKNIKNNSGLNVFDNSQPDFEVITCTTDARGGISGAPIIANGLITGIVSGSLENGYSYAWAIPVKYCNIENLTAASGRNQKDLPPLKGYLLPLNTRHAMIDSYDLSFHDAQIPKIVDFGNSYDFGVYKINKSNEFARQILDLIQKNRNSLTTQLVAEIENSISINGTNLKEESQNLKDITENMRDLINSYKQLTNDNRSKLDELPMSRVNEVKKLFEPAQSEIDKVENQQDFDTKSGSVMTSANDYIANKTSSNDVKYGVYYVKYLNSLIDFNNTLLIYYSSIYNAVFGYKRAIDYAFNLISVKEI